MENIFCMASGDCKYQKKENGKLNRKNNWSINIINWDNN